MFDIGIGEVFVLLVVALLVFGPDRLPEMARQAASFVRDLRTMVANARRDLSGSVGDLGIDKEDLKTLADLRNPKSFVRKKVLDGVDLGLDDEEESPPSKRRTNGTRPPSRTTSATTRPTGATNADAAADAAPPEAEVPPPPQHDAEEPAGHPAPAAAEPAPAGSDGDQVPVNAEAAGSPRFDPDAT